MDDSLFCETCNTSFHRREHHQRHLRTHTKEKPFTCSECKQAFGRVDSLSRHHATVHMGNADHQQVSSKGQSDRRRVAQACKQCGVAKIRCDGERPCQRCSTHGQDCSYERATKRKQSINNGGSNASMDRLPSPKRAKATGQLDETHDPTPLSSALPSVEAQPTNGISVPHKGDLTIFQFADPQHQPAYTEATKAAAPIQQPNEATANSTDASSETGAGPIDPGGWNATMPISSFYLGDNLDIDNWLNFDTDTSLLPQMMHPDPAFEAYSNVWFASLEPKSLPSLFAAPMQRSPIDQLYSRAHSPAMDQDSLEPRQYHPVSIELDAQLVFPDMRQLGVHEIDQENLAHVEEVTPGVVSKIADYTERLEQNGPYPPFHEIRIPPVGVLNSWIQLYFEHFHPVFPILHKPSFSGSNTHWLLVFVVAALGAHFSKIKGSHLCTRAMHELIRRQAASMCEQRNEYGRELFMVQVNALNHIGLMYGGERRTLEVAEILQGLPPALARRKGLFINRLSYQKINQMQLPLSQKWQIWAIDEERRRTGFGVFLLDSQFDDNFDLSRLVKVEELQMSLPQPEERWSATSAKSWATSPLGIAASKDYGLEQVIRDNSWKLTWLNTGTLGKQVLLQQLFDVMNSRQGHPGTPSFPESDRLKVEGILCELLAMTEDEESEQHISEIKASTAHQLMISTAITVRKSPTRNITAVALKSIYGRMDDQAWAQLGLQWRELAGQARLAVFWAARSVHLVRSHRCTHFSTPVSLLRAALVLWLYSMLAEKQEEAFRQPPPAPSVVLGAKTLQNMGSLDWIQAGWSAVKLPGIGNLLCAEGRCKMLDEAIALMRSLKCWAISTSYSQLLVRLRANEDPRSDDHNADGRG